MSVQNFAQFSDSEAAKQAYYGEDGPPGENGNDGNDSDEWADWQRVQQAGKWWIYIRQATTGIDTQYHITGELPDGSQGFLNVDGEVVDDLEILENMDEVNTALKNYAQRLEDGDVPPGSQPTGADPGPGKGGSGGGGLLGAFPGGSIGLVIAAIVVVGAYYYYRENGGDLELPIVGGDNSQ